jgi:quinol monooxygenase YgiN
MRQAREKDTGTLAYDWYLSKDGTECEVREAYVDADALVDHAFHVREARDALFAEFAYDHKMAFTATRRLGPSHWWTRLG